MKPRNCEPRDDIGKFCENYPEACENGTIKGGNLVSSFMIFNLYIIIICSISASIFLEGNTQPNL